MPGGTDLKKKKKIPTQKKKTNSPPPKQIQKKNLNSRCHTKRRMDGLPVHPSFGMTTTQDIRDEIKSSGKNQFKIEGGGGPSRVANLR